ncbi:MAG: outer membrane protein assembly factor [bacterium]
MIRAPISCKFLPVFACVTILLSPEFLRSAQSTALPASRASHARVGSADSLQFELAEVTIHLPDSLHELRRLSDLARSKTPAQLQTGIKNLLTELGESGYAFAKVQIDSVVVENAKNGPAYTLALRILPGTPVFIRQIRISGNETTKRNVVLRELPLRISSVFKESLIDAIPERLMRLGYFRSVRSPELFVDPQGNGVLSIVVAEGNNNAFNGVIGYNPPAGTQSGFVTGLLDVKFGNLFGTGRQLTAKWEKRGRDTQELALRYREPWLLGFPLHLEGGFQQLLQDTFYVDRKLDFSAEMRILPRMFLVGRLERSQITPDSVAFASVPKSRSLSAGLGLRYDSTDDPINPRAGAFYSTILETIDKTISFESTVLANERKITQKRLLVDAGWYQPLSGLQVLSIRLHWRQLTSGDALNPLTDVFRFGGATTLRGYREEQFAGSRIAWANIEYRYLLAPRSRVFVFYDQGYFFRNGSDEEIESYKRSFGFGARLETRLGIVGFDYGLGEGDGLLEGKVHVSLVNRF